VIGLLLGGWSGRGNLAQAAETQNVVGQTNLGDPADVFFKPPDYAKPGVLSMWMGYNLSKEGMTRDLEGARAVFGVRAAEYGRKPASPRPAKVTVGPRERIRDRENMPFVMDSTDDDQLVLWWQRGEAVSAPVGRRDRLRAAHPGR
jgi:hypothetical protein